jgi:opacity protein-like surface antigen
MNRTTWLTLLLPLMAAPFLAPQGATAADKPIKGSIKPPEIAEDFSSGYYVRADGLYQFGAQGSFGFNADTGAPFPYKGNSFDRAFGAAIGAGLRYQWLRSDLTLEFRTGGAYRGTAQGAGGPFSQESFALGAQSLMWNIAAETPSIGIFTPYVTAGIGVSRVEITNYQSTNIATGAVTGGSPFNGARYGFSYALGGGVSVTVSDRVSLDLGYRMTHLGAYNLRDAAGSSGFAASGTLDMPNLVVHDLRLGLRYMLD